MEPKRNFILVLDNIDGDVNEHDCVDYEHDQNRSIEPQKLVQLAKK